MKDNKPAALCTAVVGPAASGKSALGARLAGFFPSTVKYIAFHDSYGFASDQAYYLQQRWNHTEIDEDTPSAREILQRLGPDPAVLDELVAMFGIEGILDMPLVTFSSGELRKYQLTKALLSRPKVLVIDSPYIGLDPLTRAALTKLLEGLADTGLQIILILSRPEEIPDFISYVIPMTPDAGDGGSFVNAAGGCWGEMMKPAGGIFEGLPEKYGMITRQEYLDSIFGPEVISFNHVTVRYGERTILKDLNWVVRQGEHWVLTGQNGSGKSTLLSLVCADNPMAYACDIRLFGRKRGSGESIWEIKKKIGYVSPEMHRAYKYDQKAADVVASGLFDTVGLFYHPDDAQREACLRWMERFGIADLAEKTFKSLSSSQQRLCLVCRAFVKNPPLLILDEPLHGLDNPRRFMVRDIIDEYCADPSRTLIMVSHYPEEYPACIDHSLTLHR